MNRYLRKALTRAKNSTKRAAKSIYRSAQHNRNKKRLRVTLNSPQEVNALYKLSQVELNNQRKYAEAQKVKRENYLAYKKGEQIQADIDYKKAQTELMLAKAQSIREGKTGFSAELGFPLPKDAVYCSNCNYIDTTGKDTVCPKCDKHSPMLRVG